MQYTVYNRDAVASRCGRCRWPIPRWEGEARGGGRARRIGR